MRFGKRCGISRRLGFSSDGDDYGSTGLMKVSIVIPARLESTRLPGKLLLPLGDRPVIQHVWERAKQVSEKAEVIVATDSIEIRQLIEELGGTVRMTDPACQSGTERIASILETLAGDFILNIQGDEPFIDVDLLRRLLARAEETGCDLITAVSPIDDPDELFDPNVVKAVRSSEGRAIYFSRLPIPFIRDEPRLSWPDYKTHYRHIGIYGYRRETLKWYRSQPACRLEQLERLEQLRFIDHGWYFQTVETAAAAPGIDTQQDLDKARSLFSAGETQPEIPPPSKHYRHAREAVYAEADSLIPALTGNAESITSAVELILAATGKIIVTGLGKSGIVARKVAATFSSTGTPAVYLNAAEALHGDLGMITPGDVVMMISKSGSTTELSQMIPALRLSGVPLIGLFGRTGTRLSRECDVVLDGSVAREACPLDLAPTTSTTVAVVLGDALAVALMRARNFASEQFAAFHPSGALGRRLLLSARDVMHAGPRLPVVNPEDSVKTVLLEMTNKALGAACVCGPDRQLQGIITEGDLRRHFLKFDSLEGTASGMMNPAPVTAAPATLLTRLLAIMEEGRRPISVIPITEENGQVLGLVRLHDVVHTSCELPAHFPEKNGSAQFFETSGLQSVPDSR